ncbi:MAG: hypothetical protein A2542_04135 [Parcubacteria group bacterium RIFOXYD2_FULL_52_8]|nr:MAG: hypothetical protein A2542_04135 [Parcubacteria group bacterium RIFOXYD2_FULL_52_8]
MSVGLHHRLRKRRIAARKIEASEPFDARKVLLDQLAYVIGFVTALFNVPQLWRIWANGSSEGVSLFSWLGFLAASCFWLYYARVHREPALAVTYSITLVMQVGIVVGLLIF